MVDLLLIIRTKNEYQPTNQPFDPAPNTKLSIFGLPSQSPQKSQQLIRLAAATLGVPLASA